MIKFKAAVLAAVFTASVMSVPGCAGETAAEAATEAAEKASEVSTETRVASKDEMAPAEDIVTADMVPVYEESIKDGVYSIKVDSSSSMFSIEECELTVADGKMSAVMTMGGTGYLYLYMGTGGEAATASEEDYIPFVETEDGAHTFEVPVEALDMGIDCAAFSKKKEKWYDRILVFRADSLPQDAFTEGTVTTLEDLNLEDGSYQIAVSLEGGSGRAAVESPATLSVADGAATATIIWSSNSYDYMKVGEEKIEPVTMEEHSVFEIPVTGFDWKIPVAADTIAMSTPHEIAYTLCFDSTTIEKAEPDFSSMKVERSMELLYAEQFSVDYYEGGYALVTIKEDGRFLVVPEGMPVPENLDADIAVIKKPLQNIYLVATSAMDLFCALDGTDAISLSGTDASGWYVEKAREEMESGNIVYAGKYNAPDYELVLSKECDLAVESTMIYHSPEVKEKLESFGIPVLVERSSYETHPLGRTEWLKLYAVLLDKEEQADTLFSAQTEKLEAVFTKENTGKTVAFFYISSNGYVNVRKSGDYVAKMIELAGGKYIFDDLGDQENALSTINMQMEEFYARAKDADYLIYNSTIDGELNTLDELFAKSSLLKDFKAVQEGNVYCTGKNLFQETMGLGTMIADIHTMFTSEKGADEFTYMHRLK